MSKIDDDAITHQWRSEGSHLLRLTHRMSGNESHADVGTSHLASCCLLLARNVIENLHGPKQMGAVSFLFVVVI